MGNALQNRDLELQERIEKAIKNINLDVNVFRNILRDYSANRGSRPIGFFLPDDFNPEVSIDELCERYVGRHDGFSIVFFEQSPRNAQITVTDKRIQWEEWTSYYSVWPKGSVRYEGAHKGF